MLQQSYTPLTNGIMSFMEASEDHELAPIGIGSMHEQAQKLAEYGRHGDIYFVHAAEGETVVPMEVLNANPKVKDLLFNQMREMGLDPDEFVVGNELNSINPVTGMPEFFLSSVWRGAKKAASSVWQGVKKAAPYVVPLVLSYFGVPGAGAGSMFGPGSFGAAFLSGGIGSLLRGDDWKTTLRNAAVAGGTAAVMRGLMSDDFASGVGRSFGVGEGGFSIYGSPYEAGTNVDRWGNVVSDGATVATDSALQAPAANMPSPADSMGPAYPKFDAGDLAIGPGGAPISQAPLSTQPPPQTPSVPGGAGHYMATRGGTAGQFGGGPPIGTNPSARIPLPSVAQGPGMAPTAGLRGGPPVGTNPAARISPYVRTSGDWAPGKLRPRSYFDVSDPAKVGSLENIADKRAGIPGGQKTGPWGKIKEGADWVGEAWTGKPTSTQIIEEANKIMASAPEISRNNALRLAARDLKPGMLREYGPTAAIGAGLYAWSESGESDEERQRREMEEKEDEERKRFEESYRIYGKDPGKYYVDLGLPPATVAAQGGLAEYPRRDLLVEGRGTERSDDIPAMLSDGEFVMNSKSVRGADPSGRGNRYAGANNLYNMMRNFEMRT